MNLFLIIAFIGLAAAAVSDIKKREVADWLSYSLFASLFALAAVYSILQSSFTPLLESALFALGIYAVSSILYYAKLIGGADVKLITAISPIFIFMNALNFFSILVLASGAYGILYAVVLAALNREKLRGKIKLNFLLLFFCIALAAGLLLKSTVLVLVSVIIVSPYLIFFISAVEKNILTKIYLPSRLTEGDWLLKDIKIRGKIIKARADGLSKSDIRLIKKANAKVWIKEGVPYVPVFLIAFILSLLVNIIPSIMAFF
jgi:Flp pilus assembly protein protease CpaA